MVWCHSRVPIVIPAKAGIQVLPHPLFPLPARRSFSVGMVIPVHLRRRIRYFHIVIPVRPRRRIQGWGDALYPDSIGTRKSLLIATPMPSPFPVRFAHLPKGSAQPEGPALVPLSHHEVSLPNGA
jgi:hypothetical protein